MGDRSGLDAEPLQPMRIHLTGRITVEHGDRVLEERDVPKLQGRIVFARLVLERGPVHRDVLADMLWPDRSPATWERTLASVVSRLRSALSVFEDLTITNVSSSYELQLHDATEVDVDVASAECDAAERALAVGDAATAVSSAAVAAAICRRPFLPESDGPWVEAKRSELASVLVRALEAGAEAALGTSEAVALAGEAVEAEPYRDRANLLLLRAHRDLGNTAEALRSYERYRTLLADELGTDPGPEVQALHMELLGADAAGLERLASQGLVSLPTTRTSFIGRTGALDAVCELLRTERLVTLTGAGGVGKTRLAIEAARRSAETFPDGVWFCDLAPLTENSPIVEHVSMALGLKCSTAEALASVLDGQKILLILDNCEQVLEPVVAPTEQLLASTGPVVLATSRSALRVEGEVVWRVPSMRVPAEDEAPEDAESVALFCNRAAAVRPDFELSSANALAVASICARLDGVPLAIELAAARTSAMSAAEIAERLADRFALLRGPAAGLPRHRTLRTTIDWSYDMIGAREAEVFRQLSVFEGSFDASDAHAICASDVDREIASLCERSLLVPGDGRYRMFETIKEYARLRAEASGNWDDVMDRHIDRYTTLVSEAASEHEQHAQLASIAAIDVDAVAALVRALDRGDARAIPLAVGQWRYWQTRGLLRQANAALERAVDLARAEAHPDFAQLLMGLGVIVFNQSDFASAEARFLEALRASSDAATKSMLLAYLSSAAGAQARVDEQERWAEEAIATADGEGCGSAIGMAHLQLFVAEHDRGDEEKAREHAQQCLDAFTAGGSQTGIARASILLGSLATSREDRLRFMDQAIGMSRLIDDKITLAIALLSLGVLLGEEGEPAAAMEPLCEGLRITRRTGDVRSMLNCTEQIACCAAELDDPSAAIVFRSVDALRGRRDIAPSYTDVTGRLERLARRAERLARGSADTSLLELGELYELALSLADRERLSAAR